jgi:hypothetical protein
MDECDCVGWWDAYTFFSSAQDEEKFEFADSLRDFISLGEDLATAAEGVGLDSSILIRFLYQAEEIYYNFERYLPDPKPVPFPVADEALRIWMDRLRFRLRNKNATTAPVSHVPSPAPSLLTSPIPIPAPPSPAPSPSVVLKARHEEVLVNGVVKEPLTESQYKVIQALLAIWPKSLNKDGASGQERVRGRQRHLEPDEVERPRLASRDCHGEGKGRRLPPRLICTSPHQPAPSSARSRTRRRVTFLRVHARGTGSRV